MPDILYEELPPRYLYDIEEVRANVASSLELGLPQMDLSSAPELMNTPVTIIGGGPTLQDDSGGHTRLEEMDAKDTGFKVLAGSAYRLLDQAKIQDGFYSCVVNAPNKGLEKVFQRAHDSSVDYFLASLCHPDLFSHLAEHIEGIKGNTIGVWHAHVLGVEYPEGIKVIGPGSTSASAALILFMARGHRIFEFYGVDGGTYEALPEEYSYDMDDFATARQKAFALENHVIVKIGGKHMKVTANLWRQAEEMRRIIESPLGQQSQFTFHGESLNNLLFNQNQTAQVVHDPGKLAPGREPEP